MKSVKINERSRKSITETLNSVRGDSVSTIFLCYIKPGLHSSIFQHGNYCMQGQFLHNLITCLTSVFDKSQHGLIREQGKYIYLQFVTNNCNYMKCFQFYDLVQWILMTLLPTQFMQKACIASYLKTISQLRGLLLTRCTCILFKTV